MMLSNPRSRHPHWSGIAKHRLIPCIWCNGLDCEQYADCISQLLLILSSQLWLCFGYMSAVKAMFAHNQAVGIECWPSKRAKSQHWFRYWVDVNLCFPVIRAFAAYKQKKEMFNRLALSRIAICSKFPSQDPISYWSHREILAGTLWGRKNFIIDACSK